MNKPFVCGFLTIVLVVSIFTHTSTSSFQWNNTEGRFNPMDAYLREKQRLGVPDLEDRQSGGMVVWRRDTLQERGIPLVEIVIRDESISHPSPTPHNDFLYATYEMEIPSDRLIDVLQLSDSITYDKLKEEITVRCHFMGANYATLYLSTLIVDGTLGVEVAQNLYGPAIMQTIPSHETYNPNAEQSYINHLTQRHEV